MKCYVPSSKLSLGMDMHRVKVGHNEEVNENYSKRYVIPERGNLRMENGVEKDTCYAGCRPHIEKRNLN